MPARAVSVIVIADPDAARAAEAAVAHAAATGARTAVWVGHPGDPGNPEGAAVAHPDPAAVSPSDAERAALAEFVAEIDR